MLYAPDHDEACRRWYAMSDDRARYAGVGRVDALASLGRDFGWLMAHHHPGLPADDNSPRTSSRSWARSCG